jgi:hypothetical protein
LFAQIAVELDLENGRLVLLSSLKRMVLGDPGDSSAPCIPLHNNNNNNIILRMDKRVPLSKEEMAMLQKIEEANR